MKHIVCHLKNKYPHARVIVSGQSISVEHDGEVLCMVQKSVHGYKDRSDLGARDKFDLAPIPREVCAFSQCRKTDHIIADDEFKDRRAKGLELAKQYGKVPSIDELCKEAGVRASDYEWKKFTIASLPKKRSN